MSDTSVWYTIAAFLSFTPLLMEAMIQSTRSPSSNRTPSVSISSSQSGCEKHASDWEANTLSIVFRPNKIISRTESAQASMTLLIFPRACSAAKSKAKTFCGVVRLPTPLSRLSLIFWGRAENSDVHQPSPKSPTNARRAPRSR